MAREALSSIDRAWLRMEDPTHPMMITVLLVFDAPIDFGQLQAIVGRRLLQFPRFLQRVVQSREGWDSAAWEDDPSFDLGHHLVRTSLPAPANEEGLRAVVSELMSRQLDLSKPLWQFHLIEPCGSGCAFVGRVHHCLADGPALMHALLALTDAEPGASSPGSVPEESLVSKAPAHGAVAQLTEMLVQQGFKLLSNPLRFWDLARLGGGTMVAVNKLLWRTPDPATSFKGRLGVSKQVAWSRPVALAEVKAVGQAVGGTVNDVMLAAATGALRRYLEGHGEPVGGLTIRAGLSVNLGAPEAGTSLGNQAGALLVELPVGVDTALERIQQVKRRMDRLKDSPEASSDLGLAECIGQRSCRDAGCVGRGVLHPGYGRHRQCAGASGDSVPGRGPTVELDVLGTSAGWGRPVSERRQLCRAGVVWRWHGPGPGARPGRAHDWLPRRVRSPSAGYASAGSGVGRDGCW